MFALYNNTLFRRGIMRRNRRRFLALGLAISMVAGACGSDGASSVSADSVATATTTAAAAASTTAVPAPATTAAPEVVEVACSVPDEAVIAMAGPVLAINPDGPGQNNLPSVQVFMATYDDLTNWAIPSDADDLVASLESGNAGQAEPNLAKSWDVSDDGTVYTFHLHEGVMSDAGNELSAEDVVWSIEKSLAANATGWFWLALVGALSSVDQVEVVDQYTVQITLPYPEDKFLPVLGTGWIAIYDSVEVKSHATDEDPWANEWLNENSAGYGPYRVAEFGPGGDEVTLEARENYWGEQPALQRVVQRSAPDAGARLQLLLNGDAVYSGELTTQGINKADETDGVTVTKIPTTTGQFLALTYAPPFDDPAVRAAIAQVIPYDDIVDVTLGGEAEVWDSILASVVPGYDNRFFQGYDLDAASAVLGDLDADLTLTYAEGLPIDEEIAILVQSSMKQAGFDLKLNKMPRAQFDGSKYGRTGEIQFFVDGIDAPAFFDASYYAFIYGGDGGFLNWFGYADEGLDAALVGLTDPGARAQALLDIQEIYATDYPIHPIAWTGLKYAHTACLELRSAVTGNGLINIQDFVLAG
jgi:peptide/nickel transport system substrate-binding protein